MSLKPILILQSHASVPPGTIADFFADSALPFSLIRTHLDQKPDSPDTYGAMIVLGTPDSVHQIEKFPRLVTTRDFVKEALEVQLPSLGICFGSQLLASLSGANVKPNPVAELGSYDIELTQSGLSDPIFAACDKEQQVFQFHTETFELPESATLLASSSTCANQAFRLGNVVGLQFHPEVEESIVVRWCDEYCVELNKRELSKDEILAQYESIATVVTRLNYKLLSNFISSLTQ